MTIKPVSLPKKIKALQPQNMLGIPRDKVNEILPLLNKLKFPISREYKKDYLIITRTA